MKVWTMRGEMEIAETEVEELERWVVMDRQGRIIGTGKGNRLEGMRLFALIEEKLLEPGDEYHLYERNC